jgi:hypothetical protein
MATKLVNLKGEEVQPGEVVSSFRGELYTVRGFLSPRHAGSTGRVLVSRTGCAEEAFYPSVFDLKIVEIADGN